jgi:probable rRNA maturation factor
LDCTEGELSLLIVDDPGIARFNREFLDRPGPTNVIAFPMRQGAFGDINPHLLGDVVISVETAAREGEAAGISLDERLDQLLVHGILHLMGHDHEQGGEQAAAMEAESRRLLALLGRTTLQF